MGTGVDSIVTRLIKGAILTHEELDNNFTIIKDKLTQLLGFNSTAIEQRLDALETKKVIYDPTFTVFGKPAVNEVVYSMRAARSFSIPANFEGSVAVSELAATGAAIFKVMKNSGQVGTISFAAGSKIGTFSTQDAINFSKDTTDRLYLVAPAAQDATLADIDFSLLITLD